MLTIFIIGSASAADSDVNSTEITAASEYDEIIDVENDLDELGDGEATYSDLRNEIGTDGNVDLTKSYYRYTSGDGDTIKIENRRVINGNGAVIDMEGSNIRAFYVNALNYLDLFQGRGSSKFHKNCLLQSEKKLFKQIIKNKDMQFLKNKKYDKE